MIVLVGHEPQLHDIAEELTGNQEVSLSLERSGCCLISFQRESKLGYVSWVLKPEEIDDMGNGSAPFQQSVLVTKTVNHFVKEGFL